MQKTMRGVQLVGHGGFEMLKFREDLPVPEPGEGDVLIRVTATALNNTDFNTRLGWYSKNDEAKDATWQGAPLEFPRIQGTDACGKIVSVGKGVDSSRIGERVLVDPCIHERYGKKLTYPCFFGSEYDGGFAEYTTAPSKNVWKISSDYSDAELASFPCAYTTAENMLIRASVCEKDTVLVTGASGGVGSAAIQLAKARGAHVIGVSSKDKGELLKKMTNADKIIYRDEDITKQIDLNSIDVVVDLIGGETWPSLLDVMRPGGRYVVSGAIAGEYVKLDLRTLYLKDLTLFGSTVWSEAFANLVSRIEKKQVQPLIAQTFDLSDIVEAQQRFKEKKFLGKIVLTI